MTREEAIKFAVHAQSITDIPDVKEFYSLAESALQEQASKGVEIDTVKPGWIPVAERLPDRNGEYICRHGYNGNTDIKFTGVLEYYATDEKPHWQHESIGLTVTHWMPLPEPPNGDS